MTNSADALETETLPEVAGLIIRLFAGGNPKDDEQLRIQIRDDDGQLHPPLSGGFFMIGDNFAQRAFLAREAFWRSKKVKVRYRDGPGRLDLDTIEVVS